MQAPLRRSYNCITKSSLSGVHFALQGGLAPTGYSYDADNRLQSVTPPNKPATTYSYNGQGDRTGEVDARGTTMSWTYNGDDELTGSADVRPHERGAFKKIRKQEICQREPPRQAKCLPPCARKERSFYVSINSSDPRFSSGITPLKLFLWISQGPCSLSASQCVLVAYPTWLENP